jgi:hypothetical protein
MSQSISALEPTPRRRFLQAVSTLPAMITLARAVDVSRLHAAAQAVRDMPDEESRATSDSG